MLFIEASDLMFCIDGVSTIYVVGHTSLLAVVCGDCCAVLLARRCIRSFRERWKFSQT